MSAWLGVIERALDRRAAALTVFCRDDDAGWEDGRLLQLIDQFDRHGLPLDLAVIPSAAGPTLAAQLSRRAQVSGRLGLHQHGFAHANHELEGRPCEFGPSRNAEQQFADLENGRRKLLALFGGSLDSIFTPPWNRCTTITGQCLRRLGFLAISRDRTAGPLGIEGLDECPITIDWLKKRAGVRLPKDEWAAETAQAIDEGNGSLGLMFHHAVMDEEDREQLDGLLALLVRHRAVHPILMRHIHQVVATNTHERAS